MPIQPVSSQWLNPTLDALLVHSRHTRANDKDYFHCLPDADQFQAALEAHHYAKMNNTNVYILLGDKTLEISPNDVPFQKRPDVRKG